MDEQNNNNNYQDYNTNQNSYQNSYQQEPPKKTNVLAVVGMILGIVSILAGCCGWYGLLLGIPGLICSILSRKQGKTGMAVAGIICSVIGMIIGILMTVMASVLLILMQDKMFMYEFMDEIY